MDENGDLMPEMTHDGLVKSVQQQLQEWTSDKAYGNDAYALTWAFAQVLFDTYSDRRHITRSRLKSASAAQSQVDDLVSQFRSLGEASRERRNQQLQEPLSHHTIGIIMAQAATLKLRPTPEVHTAMKYLRLTSQQQNIVRDLLPLRHDRSRSVIQSLRLHYKTDSLSDS